ncbi:MAG TPA: hypothetical protein VF803_00475 [Candidatus Paceibacterota bacterium]
MSSFCFLLFGGLAANMSEFWFYLTTRSKFAWPTYFSIFGLCNIQRIGASPPYSDVLYILAQIGMITKNRVRDYHCFANISNFALSGDNLYLLDYASRNSRDVLRTYGKALSVHFMQYRQKMLEHQEARRVILLG